jgi:hypothetical protein
MTLGHAFVTTGEPLQLHSYYLKQCIKLLHLQSENLQIQGGPPHFPFKIDHIYYAYDFSTFYFLFYLHIYWIMLISLLS